MFARTDRLPPWITGDETTDVYPVEVLRDPPGMGGFRRRVETDIAPAPAIFGVRHVNRQASNTKSSRYSCSRGVQDNGSIVCSALPSISSGFRDHYFNDILQQVAQIAGNASATGLRRDR